MIAQVHDTSLIPRAIRLGEEIGHTPLVRMKNLEPNQNIQLWAKQEWKQLSGSVKCRPAYHIMLSAIKSGALNQHKTLLDATSGNTGIAYAAIGRALGI